MGLSGRVGRRRRRVTACTEEESKGQRQTDASSEMQAVNIQIPHAVTIAQIRTLQYENAGQCPAFSGEVSRSLLLASLQVSNQ